MRNFKMTLSYDGSRYFGWERQPGKETIQGKLEAVLTRMCGTPVNVIGAGRTRAFMHGRWSRTPIWTRTWSRRPSVIISITSCRTTSAWPR